jgi:hypothetical protein
METWISRHQTENGKRKPGDFPLSVYCLLNVQTEVCHSPFVDKTQTELSICIWTKRTCPTKLLLILTQLCKGIPKVYCCMQSVFLNICEEVLAQVYRDMLRLYRKEKALPWNHRFWDALCSYPFNVSIAGGDT